MGGGQGFGTHDVHSECHTLGGTQSDSVVIMQSPSAVQHERSGGCGQGFGSQLVQSECHTSGDGQNASG